MKISAIVSAYYCEKFLAKRLENLWAQEPRPEIILVVQTGSREWKLMLPWYADHKDAVEILHTDDVPTVYDAWNMAIKLATGDYVTSANSDDLIYEGGFARLAQALDEHPECAMAYANVDRIENWDEPKTTGRFEWAEGGLDWLYWRGCFLGPMPMWRRSLHGKYGLFDPDYRSAGDYEFWMRLAAGGEKFYHVREVLGAHLERQDSLEHRSELRSVWEQARARAKYRDAAGDVAGLKPG